MINLFSVFRSKRKILKLSGEGLDRFPDLNSWEKIYDQHGAPMLLIDPEKGDIVDANLSALRFYGYPKESLLKMKVDDINQLSDEEVQAERLKALHEERNFFIFPHKLANNEIKWVESYSSPVTLSGRTLLFSIIHDITDRKRYEDELRVNEEKFRRIFENAATGIAITNLKGQFFQCNPAYTSVLGYSEEELLKTDFFSLIHPDDRELKRTEVEHLLNGHKNSFSIENRYVHKNGYTIWAQKFVSLLKDEKGNNAYIIILVHDITARKKAEEKLIQSEKRYRMLHESLRDAFVQVSMEGKVIDCNDLYCQMLGYSRDELYSKTYQDLTPEKWHDFEKSIVTDQILVKGFSDIYEKEYRHKDGTVFPVELRTILSRDEDGKPAMMWAIVRDISDRKKNEELLKRINFNLDLKNHQLLKMNQLHENILYLISHDLRSPLANMLLTLNMIENIPDTDQKIGMLKPFYELVKKQENILNGISDILKAQSEQELESKKIKLDQLVAEIIHENRMKMEACGGSVVTDFSELPVINYIQPFIYSVIKNLITNSIKYRDEDKKLIIEIKSRRSNGFALVTIRDTGIGMDLEKHEKELFQPFKRFTKKADGTGVGLYIIKSLIEKNGGRIEVTSKPGDGSVFDCYFKEYLD